MTRMKEVNVYFVIFFAQLHTIRFCSLFAVALMIYFICLSLNVVSTDTHG